MEFTGPWPTLNDPGEIPQKNSIFRKTIFGRDLCVLVYFGRVWTDFDGFGPNRNLAVFWSDMIVF